MQNFFLLPIGWLLAFCLHAEEVTLYLMEVPPYAMNEPTRKGIVGDVVMEAARRVGDTVRIVVEPSPRILSAVPHLSNALVIPLARLKDREERFTWISHVTNVERAFFTLNKRIRSFDEAKAQFKSIAVARESAGYRILLEQGFSVDQLQIVNQGESAPRMLEMGRVDAWYNPVLEAELLQSQIGNKGFAMSDPMGTTEQYLGCSKVCDPQLVKRYAMVIDGMRRDGTLKRLASIYLGPR